MTEKETRVRKTREKRTEHIIQTILTSALYYDNSELKDLIEALKAVIRILEKRIEGGKK